MIKFKAKQIETKKWIYGYYYVIDNICYIYSEKLEQPYIIDDKTISQFINLYDKNNKEIYTNDILKIYVFRGDINSRHKNIHHGGYYLNCFVKNIRGDLEYNQDDIKELAKRRGKESFNQHICYDNSLFGFGNYYARRHVLDENGKIIYNCRNAKTYIDIEVIGSIFDTPFNTIKSLSIK